MWIVVAGGGRVAEFIILLALQDFMFPMIFFLLIFFQFHFIVDCQKFKISLPL